MVNLAVVDVNAGQRVVKDLNNGVITNASDYDPRVTAGNAGNSLVRRRSQFQRQNSLVEGRVEFISTTDDDARPKLGRERETLGQRRIRRKAEQMETHSGRFSGFEGRW